MVGECGDQAFSLGFGSIFGLDIFVMLVFLLILNLIIMKSAHESSIEPSDDISDGNVSSRAGERPRRYDLETERRERIKRYDNPIKAMKRRVRFQKVGISRPGKDKARQCACCGWLGT